MERLFNVVSVRYETRQSALGADVSIQPYIAEDSLAVLFQLISPVQYHLITVEAVTTLRKMITKMDEEPHSLLVN